MSKILDIEDYLQEHNVFVSGISGRPSHSDSYMTIIDFVNLEKALKNIPFTSEEMKSAYEYWKAKEYLSPTLGILGRTIERHCSRA